MTGATGLLVVVLAAAVAGAVVSARPAPVRRAGRRRPSWVANPFVARRVWLDARRRADAVADDVPDAVGMLSVAVAAGCNVRLALEAVVRARDGPVSDVLAGVLGQVDAGGIRLADALAGAAGAGDAAAVGSGAGLRALAALLADAERYGTPLGPSLERLGDELRQRRRRQAEAQARRLPVRLLLPLVCCVLPAFALLTVAPLLVSGLDALTDPHASRTTPHTEFP